MYKLPGTTLMRTVWTMHSLRPAAFQQSAAIMDMQLYAYALRGGGLSAETVFQAAVHTWRRFAGLTSAYAHLLPGLA